MKNCSAPFGFLLIIAVLAGMLSRLPASDVPVVVIPPVNPPPQVEKKGGLLNKIFGRKAVRVEADEDDDEGDDEDDDGRVVRAPRPPMTLGPPGTAVITVVLPAVETRIIERPAPPVPEADRIVVAPSVPRPARVPSKGLSPVDALAGTRNVSRPSAPSVTTIERDERVALPPSPVVEKPAAPPGPSPSRATVTTSVAASPPRAAPKSVTVVPPAPSPAPAAAGTPLAGTDSVVISQDAPTPLAHSSPPREPAAPPPAPPPGLPFGKPVPGRSGLVYPPGLAETPENMIDVSAFAPGTKVRDPVTKTVFRVP